jgi:hypothetical protein
MVKIVSWIRTKRVSISCSRSRVGSGMATRGDRRRCARRRQWQRDGRYRRRGCGGCQRGADRGHHRAGRRRVKRIGQVLVLQVPGVSGCWHQFGAQPSPVGAQQQALAEPSVGSDRLHTDHRDLSGITETRTARKYFRSLEPNASPAWVTHAVFQSPHRKTRSSRCAECVNGSWMKPAIPKS